MTVGANSNNASQNSTNKGGSPPNASIANTGGVNHTQHDAKQFADALGKNSLTNPQNILEKSEGGFFSKLGDLAEYVGNSAVEVAKDIGSEVKEFSDEHKLVQRGVGVLQTVGGVGEMALGAAGVVTPEPITTVAGGIAIAHGADTTVAGLKQIWTGESQQTLTEQAATASAKALGVDDQTAANVGAGVDFAASLINPANMGRKAIQEGVERTAIEGAERTVKEAAEKTVQETAEKAVKETAEKGAGDGMRVYRVDENQYPRINVSESGQVDIPNVTTKKGKTRELFINVDQRERAEQFLQQRAKQNKPATIKSFEVDKAYVEKLRKEAVLESEVNNLPGPKRPVRVDVNKAPDQYGLKTEEHIQALRDAIIQGTGKIE